MAMKRKMPTRPRKLTELRKEILRRLSPVDLKQAAAGNCDFSVDDICEWACGSTA